MTTHELKVYSQFFTALLDGSKPFEARKDDRDPPFAVGDTLRLREWESEVFEREADAFGPGHDGVMYAEYVAYTGRTLERRVTYVLRGGPWLHEGYAVLGLVRGDDTAARDTAQAAYYRNLAERLYLMYADLFPNYAYVSEEQAFDLIANEVRALEDDRARIAAALGAGADSDLVSLATTLAAFYAAHAATVERQRDALRELRAIDELLYDEECKALNETALLLLARWRTKRTPRRRDAGHAGYVAKVATNRGR